MNYLRLCGRAVDEAVLSHRAHGMPFYRFNLSVERLSGNHDLLRVLVSEEELRGLTPLAGKLLCLDGQIRSFNNTGGNGGRLLISALAKELRESEEQAHYNHIHLGGTLCRTPGYRRTPLGREICDMMLAVPRVYGRSDYIPLIAWGQTARACSLLEAGSALRIEGRFQSRNYTKTLDDRTEERIAYEVSVTRLPEEGEACEDIPQTGNGTYRLGGG